MRPPGAFRALICRLDLLGNAPIVPLLDSDRDETTSNGPACVHRLLGWQPPRRAAPRWGATAGKPSLGDPAHGLAPRSDPVASTGRLGSPRADSAWRGRGGVPSAPQPMAGG